MKRILKLIALFAALLVWQTVSCLLFMLWQHDYSGAEIEQVLLHAAPMNCTVSGWFSAVAWLILWLPERLSGKILKWYLWFVAAVTALITCLDAELFGYWGFRMDTMPIFYFMTSPAAALASVPLWQWFVGLLASALLAFCVGWFLNFSVRIVDRLKIKVFPAWAWSVAMVLAGGAIFIAIRGGVTVSTMNPGRSFFSTDNRLNQAALNPVFSLMYSATHSRPQDAMPKSLDIDADEAAKIFAEMTSRHDTLRDSVSGDNSPRPDIYFIILESFSTKLFPSLGGEPIAMRLDSVAQSGVMFSDFYASSFRTDRAIAAILSAMPAVPNISVMKSPEKFSEMPSWPRELRKNGYELSYYYGGDINFTNMKALLVTSGFDKIISDKDMPLADKLGKWGAHDDKVFARAIKDIKANRSAKPQLTVVQTSSSHEPFDVPYSAHSNPRVNSFMFADNYAADFINELRESGKWDNALVIAVGDHYGVWPQNLTDQEDLHRIPFFMTGGALERMKIDRSRLGLPASQPDIAATLLAMLGIDHSAFLFSHDIMDPAAPQFAFFSDRNSYSIKFAGKKTVTMPVDGKTGADTPETKAAKAFLFTIYQNM